MNLKVYLKYTAGIFLGIVALYWIQFNLLPIPDAPTGLNIADFGLIAGVGFWIERTIKFIIKSKPKKKTIGKIGLFIISFFIVSSVFLFINIETYGIDDGMRFGAIQLLLIIGIPWFISYSKWANDNVWNKKSKEKTIANPYKDLEKENSNSYYIKIDKKLINKILIVLGVIAVFYVGYISGGNSNTSTQTITYNEEDFEWNWLYDSDGDIISDILYYKGSPFTGVTDGYYDNGQLESIATYTDGRMNGLWESYHKNGQLEEEGTYKDGSKNGLWRRYYENSQLRSSTNYTNDKKDGLHEYYRENGELFLKQTYKLDECISGCD